MGIFDNALDPQTAGLLAAAFQGLQASGPSRMPVSMGQIIGQAGGAGLESYNSALKAKQAAQSLLVQQAHMEMQNKLLGAQITEKEQEAAKKKRIEDFYKNEAPKYIIQEPALSNVERSLEGGGGPTEENAGILSAMPPAPKGILNRIDMPGLLSAAVGAGIESPAKLYEFQAGLEEKVNARKDRMEALRLQILTANQRAQDSSDLRRDLATESNALRRELAESQRTTQLAIAANRQPTPPIQVTDSTGNVRLFDRSGALISDLGKIGKPSASVEKTAAAKMKTVRDLNETITELERATKDGGLIDQSTGSGAGSLVDIGAGFFGSATKGAIAVGAMKPIYDLVLKMVPRFEGPQSDKDTKTYQDASGQLANPAVPNSQKKAAGKEVLRLMKARRGQFISADMAGTEADTSLLNQADAILRGQ
jgi:hypothetical protein